MVGQDLVNTELNDGLLMVEVNGMLEVGQAWGWSYGKRAKQKAHKRGALYTFSRHCAQAATSELLLTIEM